MSSGDRSKIDSKIIEFIGEHHVLTLATSVGDEPWCANMFYAYMAEENLFVFTSDGETKHAADAAINSSVAGAVVLETTMVGKLQGLQFRGIMRRVEKGENRPKLAYLKRFPFAVAAKLNLWAIEPTYLKFTDNRLGFGKKLYWGNQDF